MSLTQMITTPLLGGLIGYFTNWLAIKMLFRPHTPKYFLGRKIPFTPGLIPKERYTLSKKIGAVTSSTVLTADVIESALNDDYVREKLRGAAYSAVDSLFDGGEDGGNRPYLPEAGDIAPKIAVYISSLDTVNPVLDGQLRGLVRKIAEDNINKFAGLFVNYDKIYDSIKTKLCEFIVDEGSSARIGEFIASISGENREFIKERAGDAVIFAIKRGGAALAGALDFAKIIEERINALDVAETEKLIVSVVNRELAAITVVGGVLGFVIGLLPVIMSFLKV